MTDVPKRMVSPTTKEISGVDAAAHLAQGWLMMKDASPETRLMLARAEAVAKGIDPSTIDLKGLDVPVTAITKEAREALDPATRTYLESLEADVTKADVNKSTTTAEPTEAEQFAKALEALPEPLRKTLLDQQREVAKSRALTQELIDERENARFEKMAEELRDLPSVTDTFAATMRKSYEADPEAFTAMYEVMTKSASAIHESGLFKEIGTGHTGTASAQGSIEAIAKQLKTDDPTLSDAQAIEKAAMENPNLSTAHRVESLRQNAHVEG